MERGERERERAGWMDGWMDANAMVNGDGMDGWMMYGERGERERNG